MKEIVIMYVSFIIFAAAMFGMAWYGIKEILNNAEDEKE